MTKKTECPCAACNLDAAVDVMMDFVEMMVYPAVDGFVDTHNVMPEAVPLVFLHRSIEELMQNGSSDAEIATMVKKIIKSVRMSAREAQRIQDEERKAAELTVKAHCKAPKTLQ